MADDRHKISEMFGMRLNKQHKGKIFPLLTRNPGNLTEKQIIPRRTRHWNEGVDHAQHGRWGKLERTERDYITNEEAWLELVCHRAGQWDSTERATVLLTPARYSNE